MKFLCAFLCIALLATTAFGASDSSRLSSDPVLKYPVVMLHGHNDNNVSFEILTEYFRSELGAQVFNPDNGGLNFTAVPIDLQGERFMMFISTHWDMLKGGFNLICHSMGGLVCRYAIQNYDLPIVSFVSLGAPQAGTHLGAYFPDLVFMLDAAETVLYHSEIQHASGLAQTVRSSVFVDQFLAKNVLMPYLNNIINHENSVIYRERILRLGYFALIGSSSDSVVLPKESAIFNFYADHTTKMQDMTETDWYKEDKLGLHTLANSNRFHREMVDVSHHAMIRDIDFAKSYIIPFLV